MDSYSVPSSAPTQSFFHRVLVVDDSLTVRKIISKTLGSSKVEIVEARSAGEALQLIESKFCDLIFLDYVLPDLTAPQFLDKLLTNTNYAQVPIVLMSSKGAEINRLSEFQDNVIETLVKPFPKEAIERALKAGLGPERGNSLRLLGQTNSTDSGGKPVQTSSQTKVLLEKSLGRVAAHIPTLESKRADHDPKAYYLRFLMNPELIRSFESYERHLKEGLPSVNADLRAGRFSGQAAHDLLFDLNAERRTGVLELVTAQYTIEVHIFKGAVVGASTKDGAIYIATCELDTSAIPEDQLRKACQDQAKDGQPFFLSLPREYAQGFDGMQSLKNATETLLAKTLSGPCRYVFREGVTAPQWAMEHSLNIPITDFFLIALRKIHGWEVISNEIGDLITRFKHRYTSDSDWIIAHLNSYESVIYQFLSYEYTVSELASLLALPPSRVAEAVHTLFKMGVICRTPPQQADQLSIDLHKPSKLLVYSTDSYLPEFVGDCFNPDEIEVIQCSNVQAATMALSNGDIRLIITDGQTTDVPPLAIIEKLRATDESITWLLAQPAKSSAPFEAALPLKPFDYIPRPFSKLHHAEKLRLALHHSLNTAGDGQSEFEAISRRISAKEAGLRETEAQLQQREYELLRNEEIFLEKCNRFEEERAHLDLLHDSFSGV